MLAFANAKINIGLHITEKRIDGFHNIESCFYPIKWYDVVEVISSDIFTFSSSGITIPDGGGSNLCVRAYEVLRRDFDLPPVAMHLLKNVPIGAGLGGGSADAAFVLKLLNDFFSLKLSNISLENYARTLGSDCAFFIENSPRYCFNKGDEFAPIDLDLSNQKIVLVYPNLHISTAEAYAGVRPKTPTGDLRYLLKAPIKNWKNTIKNNFEDGLFLKYPVLPQVKQQLYDLGALYASMTGSGSTLFGIFDAGTPSLQDHFEGYTYHETSL